jgi:two-component system nitrogen regulation response regulator GlnG
MSPLTQSKMLRLLQERCFERVGGNETIRTDVRVLAATNHDLAGMVARGRFREDLYYRLSVFTIRLPPLRERGEDLPLLVQHYLRRFSRELGKDVPTVLPEALDLLRHHSWPGNVRELQSVLKQALLQATGPVLLPEHLEAGLGGKVGADHAPPLGARGLEQFIESQLLRGSETLYAETLQRMERLLLTRVLQHTGGNQVQAARLLGITRGSLRTKIRELGITITRNITGQEEQPSSPNVNDSLR